MIIHESKAPFQINLPKSCGRLINERGELGLALTYGMFGGLCFGDIMRHTDKADMFA